MGELNPMDVYSSYCGLWSEQLTNCARGFLWDSASTSAPQIIVPWQTSQIAQTNPEHVWRSESVDMT